MNDFVVIFEYLLKYVYEIIMNQIEAKNNPTPQDCGAGELNRRSLFFMQPRLNWDMGRYLLTTALKATGGV